MLTAVLLAVVAAAPVPRPFVEHGAAMHEMADTLRGRVSDVDGRPVAHARVTVAELSAAVETGNDGRFAIALPTGRYTLIVESNTYGTATRRIASGQTGIEVTLSTTALRLEPVNVTVTRQPMQLNASPLPTATLAEESLRREHSVSLAKAVSRLAGVHALMTGEQIGKPILRGLSGSRVLVLENGHRLEDYSWSDEDGPSVESRIEQRIEVIRGPASVLYGSDAIGGVINALPAALPEATDGAVGRGAAELYAASNNREIGTALRYEGAAGRFGWRAFVVGRFAEDLHTPLGKLENTGFGAANGEVQLGMQSRIGTSTLRYARYGGEFKLLEASGPVPGTEPEQEEEEGPERKLSDDRIQFDGSYVLGNTRLETKAQWQRHWIAELSDDLTQPGGPKIETEVFNLLLTTSTADVLLHHGAGGLSGTIGASASHQSNDTRGAVPLVPDARIDAFAGFLFEQYDAGRISLLGGARVEHRTVDADANAELSLSAQSRDYDVVVGNAAAVLHATDQISVTANVGRAWRAPNLFETFANGPRLGEARYEVGDATMSEETSLNLDGSVRLDARRVHGEIAAFRNVIHDYIFVTPTTQFINGLRVFRHDQADATLTGGEASVEVAATDAVVLRGRYDMVRATNGETDQPLPLVPARYGAVEVELHGHAGGWLDRPYLGMETEIVADKTRVAPSEQTTDGYAVFNFEAGAQHRWGTHRLRLDLRVRNAFDHEHTSFLSRYKEFAPDPGRNIVLRLSTDL